MELLTKGKSVMLQRLDAVRNSARSDHSVTGTVKIIAIALAALTGLTLLFIVSDKAEMPGDSDYPTSLYGP
jgi:hypothetical protein